MKRWRWISPMAFALAGLLFVASARSSGGFDLRSGDHGDLISLIHEQDRHSAQLTNEVASISAKLQETLASQVGDAIGAATAESAGLARAAGDRALRGPGVQVTLNDAPPPLGEVPNGLTLDDYVVHEQDVQAVVNALWSGAAEAMSINGERITNISAIRCAGNILLLNGRAFSPPFKISAIGSPTALRKSINASAAIKIYRQYSEAVGIGWSVRYSSNLSIPKASLPSQLLIAHRV
ncbi:MAG: DUF881 domain-containing protein [Actinobacteria bacterium]|nr:DUF881 domain-containing protein [Actinomycetota bacterium]